ncbi:MAG: hypothetical protein IT393_07265 [Nitrospirae bacterium]|nr:hypothetical protein [Nitrospirota bacterium]
MEIPEKEPAEFTAGDTIKWKRTDLSSDYPASIWTLKYVLRGPSVQNVTATAEGDNFSITISASASAKWLQGNYLWEAYATKGSGDSLERYLVDSGTLTIKQNLEAVTGIYDGRSHCKKMLDAIEAIMEGRATKEHESIQIAGRSITLLRPEELIKWRSFYQAEYKRELAAEKIARGEATGRRILTRFSE